MDRRTFLSVSASATALALSGRTLGVEATAAVQLTVDSSRKLGAIPNNFLGLGYEISSVSIPGLLTAQNRVYIQLIRNLASAGVIRVGGNTSDYASFAENGQGVSAPKGTIVTSADLEQLATFLNATGWKLIWGLNLGTGTEQQAVREAEAVAAAVKDKLLAFEIGNEPDLFGHGTHRPKGYSYNDYLQEFRRYKAAIRSKLPNAPLAGPDAASATNWVTRFAADERNDLKLLTHHYYRQCAGPTSTLEKLLLPDPKLAPELNILKAASASSHVPYRICEVNSFCGGGQPGVSDTFPAALWVLNFLFTLAYADCAGVNLETGVNQLGFISSYSPIGDDEHGNYSAAPEYYGLLAFAQANRGQRVAVDRNSETPINLTSYAMVDANNNLTLTLINLDELRDARVKIADPSQGGGGKVLRMAAPSLQSKGGVTLAGAEVQPDGAWNPNTFEPVHGRGKQREIHVPAGSAAIVQFGD